MVRASGARVTSQFMFTPLLREAKVMQIFEGTNQIQRMVISRHLDKDNNGTIVKAPPVA